MNGSSMLSLAFVPNYIFNEANSRVQWTELGIWVWDPYLPLTSHTDIFSHMKYLSRLIPTLPIPSRILMCLSGGSPKTGLCRQGTWLCLIRRSRICWTPQAPMYILLNEGKNIGRFKLQTKDPKFAHLPLTKIILESKDSQDACSKNVLKSCILNLLNFCHAMLIIIITDQLHICTLKHQLSYCQHNWN